MPSGVRAATSSSRPCRRPARSAPRRPAAIRCPRPRRCRRPRPGPSARPGRSRPARRAPSRPRSPGSSRWQAASSPVASSSLRGQHRRAEQRGGGEVTAEFLGHDVRLDRPGARAAVALGQGQPGHADLAGTTAATAPGRTAGPSPPAGSWAGPAGCGPRRGAPAARRLVDPRARFHHPPPPVRAARTTARCSAWLPQAGTSARDLGQPQAEVVFLGVADRAVHLQRGPGRPVRRVGAGDLGGGHVPAGCTAGATAHRDRDSGRVQQRPGELQPDRHVGQLMLDRLERADRLAELGPLRGMPHAGLQQRAARAEQSAPRWPACRAACARAAGQRSRRRGPAARRAAPRPASGPRPPTGAGSPALASHTEPAETSSTRPAASASAANGSRGGAASVPSSSPAASPASHGPVAPG